MDGWSNLFVVLSSLLGFMTALAVYLSTRLTMKQSGTEKRLAVLEGQHKRDRAKFKDAVALIRQLRARLQTLTEFIAAHVPGENPPPVNIIIPESIRDDI